VTVDIGALTGGKKVVVEGAIVDDDTTADETAVEKGVGNKEVAADKEAVTSKGVIMMS
jgi:hypothetical protein